MKVKTIVLATNFSLNGRNAAYYALQLAHDWRATLILFHAYRYAPEKTNEAGDISISTQLIREQREKALKRLAIDLHTRTVEPVTIKYILKEGGVLTALQQTLQDELADLLIMSSTEMTARGDQLLSNSAVDVKPAINVPLMLIPPGIPYAPAKNNALDLEFDLLHNTIALNPAFRLVGQLGLA